MAEAAGPYLPSSLHAPQPLPESFVTLHTVLLPEHTLPCPGLVHGVLCARKVLTLPSSTW